MRPSSMAILGKLSLRVFSKPGFVWILTLTASNGARAILFFILYVSQEACAYWIEKVETKK